MKHLPLPIDEDGHPFSAGDVFETCVSMVKNPALRAQLRAIRPDVERESNDYDTQATGSRLYSKTPHNHVGAVAGNEIVKVYTQRMVPKASKGRPIYDRIMSVPVHGRCPFCGVGTVNTLDHYLPKTHFPIFSVTPNNLVPACTWCQKEKDEYYPRSEGEQILHPYFDDIDREIWLAAEVRIGVPAAFHYYASPPAHWTQAEKDRVTAHLHELKLTILFSSNAGSRLSEIRFRLTNLYHNGGEEAVRAHMREELASIEADHMNSWAAAMYRAAVASDWFCNGGFLDT